jgi:hypothetical protein
MWSSFCRQWLKTETCKRKWLNIKTSSMFAGCYTIFLYILFIVHQVDLIAPSVLRINEFLSCAEHRFYIQQFSQLLINVFLQNGYRSHTKDPCVWSFVVWPGIPDDWCGWMRDIAKRSSVHIWARYCSKIQPYKWT